MSVANSWRLSCAIFAVVMEEPVMLPSDPLWEMVR